MEVGGDSATPVDIQPVSGSSTPASFFGFTALAALALILHTVLSVKLARHIHGKCSLTAQLSIYLLATTVSVAGVAVSVWGTTRVEEDTVAFDALLALCIFFAGTLFPLAIPMAMVLLTIVLYCGSRAVHWCNSLCEETFEPDPTSHNWMKNSQGDGQDVPSYGEVIAKDRAAGMGSNFDEKPPPLYHEVI